MRVVRQLIRLKMTGRPICFRWRSKRSYPLRRSRPRLLLPASRGMGHPRLAGFSEAEAKPNRRIDRAPIEEAVRQATIDLREHQPGVSIELLRKLPIDDERNSVERPMAVCERRGIGAVDECTKGGLRIIVIRADHIQIVSDGVFHSSPEYVE